MMRVSGMMAVVVALVAGQAWAQVKAESPSSKPTITAALPGLNEVFADLKVAFDLVNDPKGYQTLVETLDVFIVGVEKDKPIGGQIMSSAEGLKPALTLPVAGGTTGGKTDANFQRFLENFWDLDLKTAPAPTPPLARQLLPAVRQKLPTLKLGPNERLMFGGYEGFLRREPGAVHIASALAEVRAMKGLIKIPEGAGKDLAVSIDGQVQSTDDRRKAFEKFKKEYLGSLEKKSEETETAFAFRKSTYEHAFAELERFYAENSRILLLWLLANSEKKARLDASINAVEGSTLAQSIEVLEQSPDAFAGVAKEGGVLSLSVNFGLDDVRKAMLKDLSEKGHKDALARIEADKAASESQRKTDADLADLLHAAFDGVVDVGVLNACVRSWANSDETITSVLGVRVPDGAKFVEIVQKLSQREGSQKVEQQTTTVEGVEIHQVTLDVGKLKFNELVSKDGVFYVGTAPTTVWLATGDGALERLKTAIQQATAGAQAGPSLDLAINLAPWVDVYDKYKKREGKPAPPQPTVAGPDSTREKKVSFRPGEKPPAGQPNQKATDRIGGILSEIPLRQLAVEALKAGNDSLAVNVKRDGSVVKVGLDVDTGLIRFVGSALSRFVKDNLADE